jgi:hypothetical protein
MVFPLGSDQVYNGEEQLSNNSVNRGLATLKLEESTSDRKCCQPIFVDDKPLQKTVTYCPKTGNINLSMEVDKSIAACAQR